MAEGDKLKEKKAALAELKKKKPNNWTDAVASFASFVSGGTAGYTKLAKTIVDESSYQSAILEIQKDINAIEKDIKAAKDIETGFDWSPEKQKEYNRLANMSASQMTTEEYRIFNGNPANNDIGLQREYENFIKSDVKAAKKQRKDDIYNLGLSQTKFKNQQNFKEPDEDLYGKGLDKKTFYQNYFPSVQKALKDSDIHPQVAMSQLWIESGGGKTIKKDRGFAGMFGVKGKVGDNNSMLLQTEEEFSTEALAKKWAAKRADRIVGQPFKTKNGKYRVKVKEPFKKYNSFEEALDGYKNIFNSDRYAKVRELRNDPKAQAKAMGESGYATAADYGKTLLNVLDADYEQDYSKGASTKNLPNVFLEKNTPFSKKVLSDAGLKEDGFIVLNKSADGSTDLNSKYENYYAQPFQLNQQGDNRQKLMQIGNKTYLRDSEGEGVGRLFELSWNPELASEDYQRTLNGGKNLPFNYQRSNAGGVGKGMREMGDDFVDGIYKAGLELADEYQAENIEEGRDALAYSKEQLKEILKYRNLGDGFEVENPQKYARDKLIYQSKVIVPYVENQTFEREKRNAEMLETAEDNLLDLKSKMNDEDGPSQQEIEEAQSLVDSFRSGNKKTSQELNTIREKLRESAKSPVYEEDRNQFYYLFDRAKLKEGEQGYSEKGATIDNILDRALPNIMFADGRTGGDVLNTYLQEQKDKGIRSGSGSGSGSGSSRSFSSSGPGQYEGADYQKTDDIDLGETPNLDDLSTSTDYVVDEVTNEIQIPKKSTKEIQAEIDRLNESIDLASQSPETVGAYAPDSQGRDYAGYASDIGRGIAGLAAAQTEIPKYQTGDMYNLAKAEKTQRRNLGLSDEETAFAQNIAERGYGYDVKNIRRLAGGSAGVALGNLGRAQTQLQDSYRNIAAQDQVARRANRSEFYAGATQDEMINRQQFEDDLTQAMMTKQAGAGLVGDALSNIKDRSQFEKSYGKGSAYYEMMKSNYMTAGQERLDKIEATKTAKLKALDELKKSRNELEGQLDLEKQNLLKNKSAGLPEDETKEQITENKESGSGILDSVNNFEGSTGSQEDKIELKRLMDEEGLSMEQASAKMNTPVTEETINEEETIIDEQTPITGDTDNYGDPIATDNKPVSGELEKESIVEEIPNEVIQEEDEINPNVEGGSLDEPDEAGQALVDSLTEQEIEAAELGGIQDDFIEKSDDKLESIKAEEDTTYNDYLEATMYDDSIRTDGPLTNEEKMSREEWDNATKIDLYSKRDDSGDYIDLDQAIRKFYNIDEDKIIIGDTTGIFDDDSRYGKTVEQVYNALRPTDYENYLRKGGKELNRENLDILIKQMNAYNSGDKNAFDKSNNSAANKMPQEEYDKYVAQEEASKKEPVDLKAWQKVNDYNSFENPSIGNKSRSKVDNAILENVSFDDLQSLMEDEMGKVDSEGNMAATPHSAEEIATYDSNGFVENAGNMRGGYGKKQGIKKLFPELIDNEELFNSPQAEMLRMWNVNKGFNPKVLAALSQGLIKKEERGAYHNGKDENNNIKDINTIENIDLSQIDPQVLLNELTDAYKNTYDTDENSSSNKLPKNYNAYAERIITLAKRHGLEVDKQLWVK